MSLLRIDEIFNFEKGVLQSTKCVPGEYDFITASSDWKTHIENTHECEALIFAAAASGSLGRTHYVNGKFISSDLCFVITPKNQENLPVDLKFYHILFNELKDEIVRNTKAGTSKEAIGLGSFGKYQLPYFDIDKQIEIKNRFIKLEEIKSDLSNELNYQVDLVKKLRQQLLLDAVQGKLVEQYPKDEPARELLKKIKAEKEKLISNKKLKKEKELSAIKSDEIPFEIPENWVWCKFSELTQEVKIGLEISKEYQSELNSTIYFKMNNIGNYSGEEDLSTIVRVNVTDENLSEYGLQFGDFLFNTRNSKELVGKTCIIKKSINEPVVYNNNIARVRFINTNSFYINYWFTSNNCRDILFNLNSGITNVAAIYLKQLANLLVPLPPLNEQNRIVQKLDELMQYSNELEVSIKQSESQNEKLLQQVLREALRFNND